MSNIYYQTGSAATLQDNTSASLASGSAATCATNYDNSGTSGYFWADFELQITFASAPTANSTVELYLAYAMDGTNYSDLNNTTPPNNLFVGTFPVQSIASGYAGSNQRIALRQVTLSPYLMRAYVRNQTNQSMNSGWILKMFPYRETVV